VLELLSRMSEVDSDMADITQDAPGESMLEVGESGVGEDKGSRLGTVTPTEHNPVSASSQIASSMGINPHTLQVKYYCTPSHSTFLLRQMEPSITS
jgi:nuclear pore complex protein Nup98-Nup96